ncbi:MAG: AAA family ATPase [Ardenticatenaceae bacterium]|nr:AAA family ATPase [Ardenticatenaceae bacterium]
MRQLFIGIGGGTGSGKTTIVAEVMERLRPLNIHLIHQDKFFKPVEELPTYYSDYWQKPCPDFNRPDSLRLEALLAACTAVSDCDVVILEGILVLYFPQLRQLMDIKCYVETPLEEMLIRRTQRNLARGYGGPFEEIAHYNIECVTPQHRRYNHPTKRFADVVIPNGLHEELERETAVARLCAMIEGMRFSGLQNGQF